MSQHPSACPHYHLTNLGSKLQLFRELLLTGSYVHVSKQRWAPLSDGRLRSTECEAEFHITKHLWHHILYISAAVRDYFWHIPETGTACHANLFKGLSVCYCRRETPDGCLDLLWKLWTRSISSNSEHIYGGFVWIQQVSYQESGAECSHIPLGVFPKGRLDLISSGQQQTRSLDW